MTWKEFVGDYLNFTRKDRIAILVIVLLIILVAFAPLMIPKSISHKPGTQDSAWVNAMKKLEIKNNTHQSSSSNDEYDDKAYQYEPAKSNYYDQKKGVTFYFDPNTLSEAGWIKLGLRSATVQTIQKYLNKGGHFNKPEDLQKIYGLHSDLYNRISPYVKIEKVNSATSLKINTQPENYPEKNFASRYTIIDINVADTTAFIALPGIGNKLATRIVNFREKLGGFYDVAQVGETFGLPDSTFQRIKQYLVLRNISIRKININTATADEFKAHPYIRWSIANPIIAYRNEHGPFSKVEDIKNIMVVTDEIYKKITPYLTLE